MLTLADSRQGGKGRVTRPHDLEVEEQDFERIAHFDAAGGRVGDYYSEDLRKVIIAEPEHVAALAFTNPDRVPRRTCAPRWWAYRQAGDSGHSTAHGLGGPISFADPEREVSLGFVTTTSGRHTMIDPRPQRLAALAYLAL